MRTMRKNDYVSWEAYKRRIDFLSDFYFQQDVRLQNIQKLP